MRPEVQRQIARNEDVFRRVNEGIKRGVWPGEEGADLSFRCECARLGCNLLIELRIDEYESVRAHPRRFLVAIGHEVPEAETVVGRRPGYLVVEKRDEAGREAESRDPRD